MGLVKVANLGIKMPFYFAFRENRRMKSKVKRSLTFGTKEKSRKSRGGLEGSTHAEWSDNADNNLAAYDNSVSLFHEQPRRHSLQTSLLTNTCATLSPLRRVLTPPEEERKGPPKPPRMMERKMFTCENHECQKTEELLGMIAINLKACPACFTHYCSTKCRVAHWPQHKLVCHYGRITSYMKTISEICQGAADDEDIQGVLSSVASSGYCVKGRGCVMLIFASPSAARLFIEEKIGKNPTYSSLKQVESLGVRSDHKKNLVRLINNYNPERELVLNVAIVADRNLPATPAPRNKEPSVIQQFIVSLKGSEENTTNETQRRFSL